MYNTNTIIIFLSCILGIIIFGKVLIWPIKNIVKLVFNSLLGGLLIWIINYIGASFGFYIGLNIITSIFVRSPWNSWSSFINNFKSVIRLKKEVGVKTNLFF